jgi:hypothetical protein
MANFNVHLNTAIITTGLGAAVLLSAGHINLNNALWLWFLGVIGGLLPDIDSDNSTSLDILFNLFALSGVLLVVRYITTDLFIQISFIELIAIPLLVYCTMRYLIRPLFEKITVHRGSCHSVFFLLFVALLTTQITWRLNYQQADQSNIVAWLSGGFLFCGGVLHLLLDEMCSVDLSNVRIKRSFGTAFKLADFKNKSLTLLTLMAIIALAYIAPSPDETIITLSNWSKFKL